MAKKKSRATEQSRAAERAERAAAIRREQERRQRRSQLLVVTAVIAAVALVVGVGFYIASQRDDTPLDTTAPANATSDFGLRVGEPDAPAEVVIYEDFLCPGCGFLESQINDELSNRIADGSAQVEYRPFYFLQRSDWSLRATNALAVVLDQEGVDAAKQFHDALFAQQPSEGGSLPDDDWLVEQAVAVGASEDSVREPIESLAFEGWVREATDAASEAGVRATPTVLVNGEPIEGDDLNEVVPALFAAIDAAG